MFRRAPLIAVLVVSLVTVVLALGTNLIGKTAGVDRLTSHLKPDFAPATAGQVQKDAATVAAMSSQLDNQAIPALAKKAGMSVAKFDSVLATNYPKVAVGVQDLPSDLKWFGPIVQGLTTHASDFSKADAIPLSGIPARTVPWLLILPGLLAAGFAGGALAGRASRLRALSVAGACGAVLIVGALICNVPGKSAAVDNLHTTFGPYFTPNGVAHSQRSMNRIGAMVAQFKNEALPGLAKTFKVPTATFAAQLATGFPAVGTGLAQSDRIVKEFSGLVQQTAANQNNFKLATSIPFGQSNPTADLTWLFIIPGILLLTPLGAALVAVRIGGPATEGEGTPSLARVRLP